MKRIKSYSSIWSVEHVQYSLGDLQLPFPVTYSQMAWFVGAFVFVLFFQNSFLLSWIDNVLVKWIVFPVGVTWFMSKKTFDGKKPYSFIRSAVSYLFRPKRTYVGRTVSYRKIRIDEYITTVRRDVYVPH